MMVTRKDLKKKSNLQVPSTSFMSLATSLSRRLGPKWRGCSCIFLSNTMWKNIFLSTRNHPVSHPSTAIFRIDRCTTNHKEGHIIYSTLRAPRFFPPFCYSLSLSFLNFALCTGLAWRGPKGLPRL